METVIRLWRGTPQKRARSITDEVIDTLPTKKRNLSIPEESPDRSQSVRVDRDSDNDDIDDNDYDNGDDVETEPAVKETSRGQVRALRKTRLHSKSNSPKKTVTRRHTTRQSGLTGDASGPTISEADTSNGRPRQDSADTSNGRSRQDSADTTSTVKLNEDTLIVQPDQHNLEVQEDASPSEYMSLFNDATSELESLIYLMFLADTGQQKYKTLRTKKFNKALCQVRTTLQSFMEASAKARQITPRVVEFLNCRPVNQESTDTRRSISQTNIESEKESLFVPIDGPEPELETHASATSNEPTGGENETRAGQVREEGDDGANTRNIIRILTTTPALAEMKPQDIYETISQDASLLAFSVAEIRELILAEKQDLEKVILQRFAEVPRYIRQLD